MDLALLEQTLSDRGEPRFRARQVWSWNARGAEIAFVLGRTQHLSGFANVTNLPTRPAPTLARTVTTFRGWA